MGVNVDEAGGDDAAFGVDLFRAVAFEAPDGGDAATAHRDVTLAGRGPGPVYDCPIADDKIEPCAHRSSPLRRTRSPRSRHLSSI